MLFEFPTTPVAEPLEAAIETPLGVIDLRFDAGHSGAGGIADATRRRSPHAHVLVWDLPTAHAELLLTDLPTDWMADMTATRCVAGLWRVRPLVGIDECVFSARWRGGRTPPNWDSASGQDLAALHRDDGETVVTLGAPDASGLVWQPEGNYRHHPVAWQTLLAGDVHSIVIEEYLDDGIRLRLPAVRAGEVGQVHFAVAWADAATNYYAPSYCVDASASYILEAAAPAG